MRRFVGVLCALVCVALVGCARGGREWFDPPEGRVPFEKRQSVSEFMEQTEPVFVEFIADLARRNSGGELYYARNDGFSLCEEGAGVRADSLLFTMGMDGDGHLAESSHILEEAGFVPPKVFVADEHTVMRWVRPGDADTMDVVYFPNDSFSIAYSTGCHPLGEMTAAEYGQMWKDWDPARHFPDLTVIEGIQGKGQSDKQS